jgi:hypothetical protein
MECAGNTHLAAKAASVKAGALGHVLALLLHFNGFPLDWSSKL